VALSRNTVQYTFRTETDDVNSIIVHNDDSMNELCDHCQAFHFKAANTEAD
jgi:hypothetical protein